MGYQLVYKTIFEFFSCISKFQHHNFNLVAMFNRINISNKNKILFQIDIIVTLVTSYLENNVSPRTRHHTTM